MGRIIRKKDDGRVASVAILYVEGTAEDPDVGAHEDFLEVVLEAADAIRTFPPDHPDQDLLDYLLPTDYEPTATSR